MNIDKLLTCGELQVEEMKCPKVIFETKELEKKVANWLNFKRKTSIIFGKILAGLGFNENDEICLFGMTADRNEVSFYYSVNGEENSGNKITLKYDTYFFNYELIINGDSSKVVCSRTVLTPKDIRIKIRKYENELEDNKKYIRSFKNDYASFKVVLGDYEVKLKLSRYDRNLYVDCLSFENEREIQSYLESLTFPFDIAEIYKNISSRVNLSLYSEAILKISHLGEKSKVVTDMVYLRKGDMEKFGMTKNGKTVFLDKNNNFTYKMSDLLADFSLNISTDDNVSCGISSLDNGRLNEYISTLLEYDINDARMAKEDTKKLIRTLFGSDKKGSN